MYRMPEPERKAIDALADEVAAEHKAERRCGASPVGYDFISCEREPGHQGRHWSATLNWPAS